jgi:hypothetical protein
VSRAKISLKKDTGSRFFSSIILHRFVEYSNDLLHPLHFSPASFFRPLSGVPFSRIIHDVQMLQSLALPMRTRRMAAGCLTMNVPKLHFSLDEAGNPTGVKLYPYMDSNRLIEEFMLLSNMAVARRITASFSNTSLLRIHPPPAEGTLVNVSQFCRAHALPTPASFSSFDMQMVTMFHIRNLRNLFVNI